MCGRILLCLAALLLPGCLAYPASGGVRTTCDDLVKGVTFDPRLVIGNWTTVYVWTDYLILNLTETSTISELTPAELEQYRNIVKDYPDATIKLKLRIHDVASSLVLDIVSVLIPEDTSGKINAWVTYIKRNDNELTLSQPVRLTMALKIADEFLIVMLCENEKIYMVSRSIISDETKLQQVVADQHIEGVGGGRVHPYSPDLYDIYQHITNGHVEDSEDSRDN